MTFERGVYLGRDSHGDITGGEERSVSHENPWCRRPGSTEMSPCAGASVRRCGFISVARRNRNTTLHWLVDTYGVNSQVNGIVHRCDRGLSMAKRVERRTSLLKRRGAFSLLS